MIFLAEGLISLTHQSTSQPMVGGNLGGWIHSTTKRRTSIWAGAP